MEIAFYLAGLIAVAATIRVITHTNPVHALLYLIVSLLAISAVFFLSAPTLPARWKSSFMRAPSWCCSCSW